MLFARSVADLERSEKRVFDDIQWVTGKLLRNFGKKCKKIKTGQTDDDDGNSF